MDNIKYLLQKISLIHDKAEIRKSQQETFNIFTTLLYANDEVNLHSRFISSILDPNSPHKFNDTFLKLFLNVLKSRFVYNIQTLEVMPSTSTWTEYKEIDILLIDRKTKSAVIVENKINARDSNHEDEGQLERYYRRIVEEDSIPPENIEVYYLRPFCNTLPSNESVSTSNKYPELPEKVKCISYEQEISKWIELCIKESSNSPFLRETFNQYLRLIKEMTNDTDIQERLDIINTLSTSEETLKSAKVLFDNYCHIQWHTIANFLNDLCAELTKRGYNVIQKVDDEDITQVVFGGPKKSKEPSLYVAFSNSKGYVFEFEEESDIDLYFGLRLDENREKYKEIEAIYNENKQNVEGLQPSDGWLFYRLFDIPENDGINLWDFTKNGTFNLIRSENRKKSIDFILDDFERTCDLLNLK